MSAVRKNPRSNKGKRVAQNIDEPPVMGEKERAD